MVEYYGGMREEPRMINDTPQGQTNHCPMCEDAAKKILELEQRVKVLETALDSCATKVRYYYNRGAVANEALPIEIDRDVALALNQTPQQSADQVLRWHVEYMMTLPAFGVWHQGDTDAESDFFLGDVVDADDCAHCTKLVAIPSLPKD